MFAMPILDVAIGLSFFYLLLGLICSTVNEMIAARLNMRAKFLDHGIVRLLAGDTDLKKKLYEHPLIRSLASSDEHICPSYIPAQMFAAALLDVVSGAGKAFTDLDAIRAGAKNANPELQTSLQLLLDASPDAAALQRNVENWFKDGMDRVSGWYKRNAQRTAFLLACAITLIMNADTVHVTHILWTNPTMRAAVVESARMRADKGEALPMVEYPNSKDATESKPINVPQSPEEGLTTVEQDLLGQLTGWGPDWKVLGAASDGMARMMALMMILYNHAIGWGITAVAVSLGAPFWFDTLNRFMNVRAAGRAPDEPRDKSSSPQKVSQA